MAISNVPYPSKDSVRPSSITKNMLVPSNQSSRRASPSIPNATVSRSPSAVVKSPRTVKEKPSKAASSDVSLYQSINKASRDEENVYTMTQSTSPPAATGTAVVTTDLTSTVSITESAFTNTMETPQGSVKIKPAPTVHKETKTSPPAEKRSRSQSDYEYCRQWYYQLKQKNPGSAPGTDTSQPAKKGSAVGHSSLRLGKLESSAEHTSTAETQQVQELSPPQQETSTDSACKGTESRGTDSPHPRE